MPLIYTENMRSNNTVVHVLHTCSSEETLEASLLFLKTIRIGFPNSEIRVSSNKEQLGYDRLVKLTMCQKISIDSFYESCSRHPLFIEHVLGNYRLDSRQLVFVDTDMIFYDSCEFEQKQLLLGRYIPAFFCGLAKAVTLPRLHTSLLYVKSGDEYRQAEDKHSIDDVNGLIPTNLVYPQVFYSSGIRFFFDTMSNAFNLFGGQKLTSKQLDCYSHLHSGTLIDKTESRITFGPRLRVFHQEAIKNPEIARGCHREQDRYYEFFNPKKHFARMQRTPFGDNTWMENRDMDMSEVGRSKVSQTSGTSQQDITYKRQSSLVEKKRRKSKNCSNKSKVVV